MGVVYLAKDTMLDRSVAVKVFRDGTAERARTASETQLLARLNHPALVTLFDAHVAGDEPRYLVMEYVEGPTLQSRLLDGPIPPKAMSRIARDLGEALHVVHQAGIVHRDIKPANVLLRPSSVPGEEFHAKLADFGIAYLLDSTRLTVPGTVIGSAAYLSPEQVMGASPGPPSDVYALGLVLLEALTGRRAFAQDGGHEAALARLTHDPVIPGSVGTQWGAILTDMTVRDPGRRPSALDVVIRLGDLGEASSVPDLTVADPEAAFRSPSIAAAGGTRTLPNREGHPGAPRGADATTLVLPATAHPVSIEAGTAPSRRVKAVRWLVVAVIALIASAAVVAGVVTLAPRLEAAPSPTLPSVDDPLASHLEQLLDSVSP